MSRKHRRRNKFHRRTLPGASPGMIVPDPSSPPPVVTVMAYGPDRLAERTVANIESLQEFVGQWPVTWINIDGLGDADTIRQLGEMFKLHPLALEDVVNLHQRAKVEQYDDQIFMVVRMAHGGERLESEQVSMFLSKSFILTFQETLPGDSFEPVRQRIRAARGQIRNRGCDYLAYALMDSAIDSFFPILELLGEQVESLEEEALVHASRGTITRIHDVKHDLLTLRRAIWPAREALHALARDPCSLISNDTRIYFRDCYDHTIQLLDLLETYRELGADLRDLYVSAVSNRMNEIMKVLTIIATIFIPLSFIVGLYGMNFKYIPELEWKYGYAFVWIVMAAVVVSMLYYFHRKGWIGAAARERRWEEERAQAWNNRDKLR
ncbi:MAG: magnesium/cobalt transporter CorA [Pirellulales bacterium]|nr:magnesium/cobalt transporter CorA [Pirellulales bacterium]